MLTQSEDETPQERGVNLISGRSIILSLPLDVIKTLFGGLTFKIHSRSSGEILQGYVVKLTRLLTVLSPHQNGYCCFTFEVIEDLKKGPRDLSQFQDLIHQLTRLSGEYKLTPCEQDESIIGHPLYQEQREQVLPPSLLKSAFSLRDLTLWLIALNDDEANLNTKDRLSLGRCGHLRKYPHHTSLHLDAQDGPQGDDHYHHLRLASWSICRAMNEHRKPSPQNQLSYGELITYDNMILRASREGTCALSWEVNDIESKQRFDTSLWSSKNYHGIYLIFYLHTLGEEAMLEDFSYQSLEIIKHNISISTNLGRKNYLHRLQIRDMLRRLIYEMVYLNLSFSSVSTGNNSDYMFYLKTLKEIYLINDLRSELRDNISELSDIVEQIDQEQQQRFDNGLTVLGAIVLPFGIVSGLMGMNNFQISDDAMQKMTPSYLSSISFNTILGVCLLISLMLLIFARSRFFSMWRSTDHTTKHLMPPKTRVKKPSVSH